MMDPADAGVAHMAGKPYGARLSGARALDARLHRTWLCQALPVIVAMAALFAAGSCGRPEPAPHGPGIGPRGIAPRGGEPMKSFSIGSCTHRNQGDPRWGSERLGGSNQSLAAAGCVMCSVSMGLEQFGIAIDPGELTRRVRAAGGFTETGLLDWPAVTKITGGRIEFDIPDAPTHAAIDDALRRHRPVLAKLRLASGVNHWVLITGKDSTEYLMHDPLADAADHDVFSRYGSNILAIRIMRRSDGG